MKEGIHPKYKEIQITCACGEIISTKSTLKDDAISIAICAKCHPFFTGKQKLLDTGGRIEKFNKKYAKKVKEEPKGENALAEAKAS